MVRTEQTLKDPAGLHARLAVSLAECAKRFESALTIRFKGIDARADDVLQLMQIDASEEDVLLLSADGPDEDEALNALSGTLAASC